MLNKQNKKKVTKTTPQVPNGIYYGLNQLSENLIIHSRNVSENQNNLILGRPGAGKAFHGRADYPEFK